MRCKAKWVEIVCDSRGLLSDRVKDELCQFPEECPKVEYFSHGFEGEITTFDETPVHGCFTKWVSLYTGEKRKRLLVRGTMKDVHYGYGCGIGYTYFEYLEIDGDILVPLEKEELENAAV